MVTKIIEGPQLDKLKQKIAEMDAEKKRKQQEKDNKFYKNYNKRKYIDGGNYNHVPKSELAENLKESLTEDEKEELYEELLLMNKKTGNSNPLFKKSVDQVWKVLTEADFENLTDYVEEYFQSYDTSLGLNMDKQKWYFNIKRYIDKVIDRETEDITFKDLNWSDGIAKEVAAQEGSNLTTGQIIEIEIPIKIVYRVGKGTKYSPNDPNKGRAEYEVAEAVNVTDIERIEKIIKKAVYRKFEELSGNPVSSGSSQQVGIPNRLKIMERN